MTKEDKIIDDYFNKNIEYDKRKVYQAIVNRVADLEFENEILRHRLEVANEYIDSRKENMIIDNYDDLKYIINECDLESTW